MQNPPPTPRRDTHTHTQHTHTHKHICTDDSPNGQQSLEVSEAFPGTFPFISLLNEYSHGFLREKGLFERALGRCPGGANIPFWREQPASHGKKTKQRSLSNQKKGFSKGEFFAESVSCQEGKRLPKNLDPEVHLALRGPQPKRRSILQKLLFQETSCLGSWILPRTMYPTNGLQTHFL